MKSTFLTVAAAALLLTPTLHAQDKPADKPPGDRPAGGPGGPGGGRGAFDPEAQMKRMTEQLGLTPEQAEKIKAINAKYAEMRKTQQEEIAAVLTPEQKKKQEEARGRFGGGAGAPGEGRRRGAGGPGAPGGEKVPTPPAPEAK